MSTVSPHIYDHDLLQDAGVFSCHASSLCQEPRVVAAIGATRPCNRRSGVYVLAYYIPLKSVVSNHSKSSI